jgi:heme-degrading monooxygenase HmoA
LPVDTDGSRAATYIAASTHPSKGSNMFTRIVSMTLKPNVAPQFSQLLEQKLVPALRKEPGFQDEVVFVVAGGPEVVAISVWKTREDLENYARGGYRNVLGMLETLIEKEPRVEVYQLAYSTIHRTGLSEFPKQSPNTTPPPGVGG